MDIFGGFCYFENGAGQKGLNIHHHEMRYLARVQGVHKPADLLKITFCTR
jgi:hypothetical protein